MNNKTETTSNINHKLMNEFIPSGVKPIDWQGFRAEYKNAVELGDNGHPVQLNIELNSQCNLKCGFCYHGHHDRPLQRIEPDDFRNIIVQAVKLGVKSIKISNINEPLLRLDLESHIRYAKKMGIYNIYFSTNGLMLTPSRIKSLIESGVTKIFVSLDAVKAETYEKQRGSKQFWKVVANVQNLIMTRDKMGLKEPLVRVSFLQNRLNEGELAEFIEYWEGKADMVGIQKMYEVPGTNTGLSYKSDLDKEFKCSMPFKMLTISSNGDIYPCCTMYAKELKLGNIKGMTLEQAWNCEKMKYLKKIHRQGNYHLVSACLKCVTSQP